MPKSWKEQVEQLAVRLEAALGANLRSLLLYGSAARTGTVRPDADINLLLIVRDPSAAALRPVAEAISAWVKAGNAPPLVFGEGEWRASADVFPIEVEDMRDAHQVIRGSDPLAGVSTTADDLRRELEREVRGKLLRLRTEYAAAAPDGKALAALLARSSGTIFALLRAALRLAGRTPPADVALLAREAAAVAGFAPSALEWAVAQRAGSARSLAPFDPAAAEYVDAVQRLAAWVDEKTGAPGHRGTGAQE